MTENELKNLIQQQLPELISRDPSVRDFILRTVSEYYAPKQETESKFDRILNELARDREEQARKWEENNRKWDENNRRLDEFIHQQELKWEENNRKWDENNRRLDEFIHQQELKWEENNRKWDENSRRLDEFIHQQELKWEENNRKWDENSRRLDEFIRQQELKWDENNRQWREQHKFNQQLLEEIKKLDKKYDSTIGALGSRWGLYSEASFRNALKGILEDSFGVQVLNINEFDQEGEVFGRPDQVEIDVIIKNGLLILCEIKSSMDKAGMYYQKRHQRQVTRKLVISPMVDNRALPVAQNLGIEVYSYAEDVSGL